MNPQSPSFLVCLALFTACGGDSKTPTVPDVGLPTDAVSLDPTVIILPDPDSDPSPDEAGPSNTSPESGNTVTAVVGPSTFRIRNTGSQTVFLRGGCDVGVRIFPIGGEWNMSTSPPCACDCADPTCVHVECPGCLTTTVVSLATGGTMDVSWLPRLPRRQFRTTDGAGPLCVNYETLPPGPYLVHVTTFPTAGDATTGTNANEVVTPFSLQATPSIIAVDLP